MKGLEITTRLDQPQIDLAVALIEQVTEFDGLSPVSEHVLLHLRHGGDDHGRHFLLWQDEELVGYAHLDVTDEVEGPSAEIAVAPKVRTEELGRALISEVLAATPSGRLRLWAHGEQADAGKWALSLGFRHLRTLWQMRRSLLAPLPPAVFPEDVVLRTFIPGVDDEEWVKVNALAFAGHMEQGDWTINDLHRRMQEPWFSVPGFLIAADKASGRMLGFHWTKVHGSIDSDHHHGHVHEAIGEVYVVGVDPTLQGKGLGRALTLAGLHHMRSRGLVQSMLYVDATNEAAITLYEDMGFARWDVDVMYRYQSAI
ncbi:MAG: mycothiol synthase [Actinomycetota bacterium]|nr:mycothiol synthase [Actinomycetota bacterium]MDP2287019.1 mycothiol synthase [Actinomycetota bacterium]